MENAVLVLFDSEGQTKKLPELNETYKIGKKGFLIESIEILDKDKFEDFKKLFSKLKKNDQTVIFKTYQPFHNDIEKLNLLKESQLSFRFIDFSGLTQATISTAINLYKFNSNDRSKKIKAALNKKREDGVILGNPEIALSTGKAIRKRKLKAWKNENNIIARKCISYLKEKEKWSYNQIADFLNQEGLKTSKNNNFIAKSVQRLYSSHIELNKLYSQKKILSLGNLDNSVAIVPVPKKKEILITGLIEDSTFDKNIQFTIISPLKKHFEILIRDNKNEKTMLSKVYPPEKKYIDIDLEKNSLLPGTHFMNIITDENDEYTPLLHVRIFLRVVLKFDPNDLRGIEDCRRLIANEN